MADEFTLPVIAPEQKSKNVKAFEDLVKVAALGDTPIAPLTTWYSLASIEPTRGYWYFSFDCPQCQRVSPMFRDFSDGHMGNPFANYGIQADCYFCSASVAALPRTLDQHSGHSDPNKFRRGVNTQTE